MGLSMKTIMLTVMLGLSTLAWADPTYQVDTKIVREYEENGESKRVEYTPSLRFDPQSFSVPNLQDENAQKMFSSLMQMFTAQAAPMLSQMSNGQPFQLILEIPNMKEKLNIELSPRVENP